MQQATSVTIKQRKFCRHLEPGWKQCVAPIHEAMRERRRQWIYAGRPRDINNPYYRNYKDTKRIFRRELELDHAAVFVQCRFWTLINRKRKRKGVKINELKVGDTVYREPAEILLAWERYFSDLYTIKTDRKYDCDNFTRINNLVETYKRESVHSHDDILDSPISDKEISCHIKNLKTKVATGIDMIANEHLIHGGKDIIDHIVRLSNLILEHEHFPPDQLKGAIIILPKPGKPPNIQKNNRGI